MPQAPWLFPYDAFRNFPWPFLETAEEPPIEHSGSPPAQDVLLQLLQLLPLAESNPFAWLREQLAHRLPLVQLLLAVLPTGVESETKTDTERQQKDGNWTGWRPG